MTIKAKCGVCGEGDLLVKVSGSEHVGTHKGQAVLADQIYLSCTHCKGDYADKYTMQYNRYLKDKAIGQHERQR